MDFDSDLSAIVVSGDVGTDAAATFCIVCGGMDDGDVEIIATSENSARTSFDSVTKSDAEGEIANVRRSYPCRNDKARQRFAGERKIVALEGMEGVTVDMIVLCPCLLRGGGWSPNMDVFLKWSGSVSQGSSSASGYQMVGLNWINAPADRTKYLLEVNPVDNVSWVLRKQIQEFEEKTQFRLSPHCAYYFLYKQQVMNQQESFDWHGVGDGDTIRVFFGYVTDTLPFLRFNKHDGFYYL